MVIWKPGHWKLEYGNDIGTGMDKIICGLNMYPRNFVRNILD